MWLLDILGSAGLGTIVGGVFGWLGKREERANMQMKFDHDESMVKAKTAQAVELAKMGVETAKAAGQLAVDKVEAKAFKVSQKTSSSFAEVLKALVRPTILGVLMYQVFIIQISLEELTGGLASLPEAEVVALYKIVILAIVGLTSTAVGWYYGARSSKQFDKLLDKWHK